MLGSRAFLDVHRRQLVQLLPAATRPTTTASRATSCPAASTPATNQRTGYHDSYQDQKRYKPQVYVSDVVLQGRLEGQPRLQVRLRLEARPAQLRPAAARWQHLLPRPERRGERARAVQLAEHVAERRGLQRRLHQRHLEVQRPPDAQPRASASSTTSTASPISRSRRTATPRSPTGRPTSIPPSARATWRSSRRSAWRRAKWRSTFNVVAARRLRLRPDRRQPHGAEGLLRPLLLQLGRHAGRPREPGRHRAPALPVPRPERQPPARRPAGTRRCSARRRAAPASSTSTTTSSGPYSQEFSAHLEREIVSGLSGRVSYVYKKRARRMGRNRPDPRTRR